MLELLETALRILGWATLVVLAVAVVRSFLPGRVRPGRPSPAGLAAMALVGLALVVGVVAGLRAGIPLQTSVPAAGAFVLVSVLLRRDERYWVANALLVVLYTVVGWVSVRGFGHNYDALSGGWRGVRLLVAWGGANANPTGPHADAAVLCLAIMRYGLPLATTVALAWVLATRRELQRLDRVALLLVSGTFLGEVVVGATLSAITFAVGAISGLPLGTALAGLAASLVMLVTVGPGAVTGIVVGVRWLVTVRQVGDVAGLVTTLRGVGEAARHTPGAAGDPEPSRLLASLGRFLRGNVGWVQKLNVVVIVLAFLLIGGLGLSFRVFSGDPQRVEVSYQYVDPEVVVPGRVARALEGPGGRLWLLTRDERLRTYDPATGELADGIEVTDARTVGDGDRIVAVTREATPRVVLVEDLAAPKPVVTLTPGSEPSVAVTASRTYVAEQGGRALVLDPMGRVLAEKRVEPTRIVVTRGEEVWTVHPRTPTAADRAIYVAVRRDPAGLAELGRESVAYVDESLVWLTSRRAYNTRVGVFYGPTNEAPRRWSVGDLGRVTLTEAGKQTRYDFSYDGVMGVFDTPDHGTWLVVDDHVGIALTPRQDLASYVVRWPGAPVPSTG